MPFINAKFTQAVSAEQKETIKSAFGQYISTLHKPEAYLMVGIEDNYDLWFAGKKLTKGAYVEVSLFGEASSWDYNTLTGQICELLNKELKIPKDKIYITYHPVAEWGWNGRNF